MSDRAGRPEASGINRGNQTGASGSYNRHPAARAGSSDAFLRVGADLQRRRVSARRLHRGGARAGGNAGDRRGLQARARPRSASLRPLCRLDRRRAARRFRNILLGARGERGRPVPRGRRSRRTPAPEHAVSRGDDRGHRGAAGAPARDHRRPLAQLGLRPRGERGHPFNDLDARVLRGLPADPVLRLAFPDLPVARQRHAGDAVLGTGRAADPAGDDADARDRRAHDADDAGGNHQPPGLALHRDGAAQGLVGASRDPLPCAAQRLGADRHRDRLQPRVSRRGRRRGRSGLRLSRHRATDGRRGHDTRHPRGAGLRPDLRRHLHHAQSHGRHHLDRHQSEAPSPAMTDIPETYSATAEVAEVRTRRTWRARAWIELRKAPVSAWFGLTVIVAYIFVAVFAPLLAPHGEAQVFPQPYAPWSPMHPLGTDQIGRDVLSRLIYGARNTIGIALATTFLAFIIGGGLALVAAIARAWTDQILSRLIDVLMAIPSLIFALMLLSIFGSTVTSLIIIIAVLDSTRVFRLTRAVAMNVVVMEFVEAARLRGEGTWWIMRREILPNIMPPLVAEFGLRFCFVFLTIAALSFLGRGIQPPTADWGSMVRENASLIQFAQYDLKAGITPLLPAAAIALLTIGVNFVVDWFLMKTSGLRDEH